MPRTQIFVFDGCIMTGRILFIFCFEDCFSGNDWKSIFKCSSEFCALFHHGFDKGFMIVETVSIVSKWSHTCWLIRLHRFHEFLRVDIL